MTDWMDGMPFVLSIVLKLASSIPDTFYASLLIRDMPDNYKLTEDQKKTIAAQALDASERLVFIVTMFSSILLAAVICLKKHHTSLFVVLLLILVVAALLGILRINSFPLGYLETRNTIRNKPSLRQPLSSPSD
jgi:lipopolysaccharide export LptBFGC system permease protein LptF